MTWTVEIHPKVEKFIEKRLEPDDQVRVIALFERLEEKGVGLGWPYTRQIEGKLWELRPRTARGSWRFLYVSMSGRLLCVVYGMPHRSKITQDVKRIAYNRSAHCEET